MVQTSPVVAIVVLNYNGRHYLQKFLPSVIETIYSNKRIIVADNASTDGSVAWLREYRPEVEIVINGGNLGYAKGYNEALKKVEADYYVLLNSDVEVTPSWMDPIIELMESDDKIAACQPKMLAYNNKEFFEYAGAAGGWIDMLGYPFSRGRVFDDCEEDKGQYDLIEPIFWASGAALFVKSNVYHELNGLDEYFFAHQEEIDLCWRMQLAGYTIMACPQSVVYHVGGGTLPKGERKVYLNFRNNLVMLAKNYSFSQALLRIPVRILLDVVAAIKSLISGDKATFKGIIKAHLSFVAWIVSDKKENTFPPTKKGSVKGYFNGSVVWHYFVEKKKTFSEIVSS